MQRKAQDFLHWYKQNLHPKSNLMDTTVKSEADQPELSQRHNKPFFTCMIYRKVVPLVHDSECSRMRERQSVRTPEPTTMPQKLAARETDCAYDFTVHH